MSLSGGLAAAILEELIHHWVVEHGGSGELLENFLRAVSNSCFKGIAELLVDLILGKAHVISIDLEESLVNLNHDVGQVEAKALKLRRIIEVLERDSQRLELLLDKVKLNTNH